MVVGQFDYSRGPWVEPVTANLKSIWLRKSLPDVNLAASFLLTKVNGFVRNGLRPGPFCEQAEGAFELEGFGRKCRIRRLPP